VLTGNIVRPDIIGGFDYYHSTALEAIRTAGIPWVWTGGDEMHETTREEMARVDQEYDYTLSWTGYQWDKHTKTNKPEKTSEQLGYYTSRIPIMSNDEMEEISNVYVFDSKTFHDCNDKLPGQTCISPDAIEWYINQNVLYSHSYKGRDFIFMFNPV